MELHLIQEAQQALGSMGTSSKPGKQQRTEATCRTGLSPSVAAQWEMDPSSASQHWSTTLNRSQSSQRFPLLGYDLRRELQG